MKDMCCICGRNLRPEGGFSGERNEPTTANVSMIHHVPELVVSKEIADELGARDHENIVRQRRLILLLDLDQTLVHTANRPLRAEEMGASDLTVYRLNGCTFCTKIRPNTRKLLDHLNNLFEMHIVTFGQRMYAHKIAELLDPQRKYFDYRILSRDELLSSMHKTGNLKALFPCSEQMILMLDDRPDVWMHSDALIRVKPYRFFMEVGDINAPPQELLDSAETSDGLDKARNLGEEELKEESAHHQLLSKDGEENVQTKEREQTTDEKTMAKSAREGEMPENRPETVERTLTEPIGAIVDEDNALVHVERVLSEVHSLFYQQYDRDKKIPDVKRILAWLRFQVLCGEQIVFSGIIPLGVDVKACEIYRMCTRFGAKVGDRIVERKTTVLVAARAATEKFRHAQRLRIPIVSTLWLDACFERWQRVDKRDFLFREEDEQQTTTPSGESKFNEQEEGAGLRKRMAENKTTEMGGSSEEAAEGCEQIPLVDYPRGRRDPTFSELAKMFLRKRNDNVNNLFFNNYYLLQLNDTVSAVSVSVLTKKWITLPKWTQLVRRHSTRWKVRLTVYCLMGTKMTTMKKNPMKTANLPRHQLIILKQERHLLLTVTVETRKKREGNSQTMWTKIRRATQPSRMTRTVYTTNWQTIWKNKCRGKKEMNDLMKRAALEMDSQ